MTGWDMDFRRFAKCLSRAGEGTGFVYPTVVTPVTPEGLRGLVKRAYDSADSIRSKIRDGSHGHPSWKVEGILEAEIRFLSSVDGMSDADMMDRDRIYILAHTAREFHRINTDIGRVLDRIAEAGPSPEDDEALSRLEAEVRMRASRVWCTPHRSPVRAPTRRTPRSGVPGTGSGSSSTPAR